MGNIPIESVARALYKSLLRREPAAEEVSACCVELAGSPLESVIERFLNSDEARRLAAAKFFVEPGSYYSPLVNLEELRRVPPRNDSLPLMTIDGERMRAVWRELAPLLRACPLPDQPAPGFRYHFDNSGFGYQDGSTLYAMLRHLKPRRYVEVGSGNSSACLLDTLDLMGAATDVTFIEPYPALLDSLLKPSDRSRVRIIAKPVQLAPDDIFDQLEAGDILFIDSTHVARTGSDVCHELFNVLPYLKPGVVIHFHDIFHPFEYPHAWIYDDNRSWNELYILRAFLMDNPGYEIIFFCDYFVKRHRADIEAVWPRALRGTGASLWLRKVSPAVDRPGKQSA